MWSRAVSLTLLVSLVALPAARADSSAAVAHVGPREVRASEFLERYGRVPEAQRALLGGAPKEQQRAFLEGVLVREELLDLEAERLRLERAPGLRNRLRAVLRDALVERLKREAEASITRADVEQKLAAHRDRYAKPERLRLWRILVDDANQAKTILGEASQPKGLERWAELARKSSQDRATAMRRGDLGMVYPDGRTDVPTVRVAPELYAAAARVRDGELVPEPVAEGSRWAVVWRRGALPERKLELTEAEPALRAQLVRERVARAAGTLLADLRREHVKRFDPTPVLSLPWPLDTATAERPRPLTPHPAAAPPTPSAGEQGLR
jgi:peptidyl-prolyl cis-trans isomerase C